MKLEDARGAVGEVSVVGWAEDARNGGDGALGRARAACHWWEVKGEADTYIHLSETTRLKEVKLATSISPWRLKRSLHISCFVLFRAAAVGGASDFMM